jgi:hypothetical protein
MILPPGKAFKRSEHSSDHGKHETPFQYANQRATYGQAVEIEDVGVLRVIVVLTSFCPSSGWTVRMSSPLSR